MYKEIALDPACMGSMEYYGLVRQHFGYDHGRYISDVQRQWAADAMASVKASDLTPIKQQSVKNYLNGLVKSKKDNAFHLACDRKKIPRHVWTEWHKAQISLRPFTHVISESQDIKSISIDDINNGCDQWQISRSISIERNARAITQALTPLLAISRFITIIDPYFRLAENEALRQLITCCQSTRVVQIRVASTLEIHSPDRVYENEYKILNANNISLVWFQVPDKYFHDRYFITEVGAIKSGQGFMQESKKGTHADKANLNIIGKDEADRTLYDLTQLIETERAVNIFSST